MWRILLGTTPRIKLKCWKGGGNGRRIANLATLLIFFGLQFSSIQCEKGLQLNEFIEHFEPAFFSLENLRLQHRNAAGGRAKRHAKFAEPKIAFNFTAHNKLFQVELQRDASSVFSDDIHFENSNGPIHYNRDKVYSGILKDTPYSTVHGVLTADGHFDGHISTPQEQFYVEPSNRYFTDEDRREFHTVIYKASDVKQPQNSLPCKSHELHLKHKESQGLKKSFTVQSNHKKGQHQSKQHENVIPKVTESHSRPKRDVMEDVFYEHLAETETMHDGMPKVFIDKDSIHPDRQMITTLEVLDWADVPESVRHHFRKKSNLKPRIDKRKKTCMLYLQADHLFYEKMGSEEASIDVMTRHVQRVNSIYREIDFDRDGKPDNITFMIKRIKVYTPEALKDPKYRFPGNYGVEKFLEIFSEENYDAFCLAYMFTYRDFEGGTLGLAWTGDLKNAGGVCERNGHYRGSLKSLNTGIVTLLNYGKHVPPAVSHVTMAHEMGHNFGSPHDPENNKVCVPGGEDGNYIMFARATSGDKKNNRKFSPCSLKSVKQVLTAKARGFQGCFIEPKQALCGNGVVEEGEECDCGWEEDCEEECCWPQKTNPVKGQKPCTLRPKKACSPTQGPCCSNDCQLKVGDKCRDDNGCRAESFCEGLSPSCPMSELKPNKTVCNKEFVCYKGECTGSICLAYGMQSCQCEQGMNDAPTKACELCCKEPGDDKPCLSSFELNESPFDVPDMFSKPGTPCNNYKGYCDVFQKCREVDPSGPLATLRKILLSEESIATLRKFLETHWYTVIFIALAVLLLMAVIVRFCGKKTPLVRRRKRRTVRHDADVAAQSELVLPDADIDAVQVHPVTIEASVPFGKKVRKGENRKKRRKRKESKKQSQDTTEDNEDDWRSTTQVAVSRAARLAANLSQLIVNLPPENEASNSRTNGATTSPERIPTSPDSKGTGRSPRKKSRSNVEAKRHTKSLSPEKTITAGVRRSKLLADSVTSISKSFEKLDLIGKRHKRRLEEKGRHSKTRSTSKGAHTKEDKERTIAKIGKFKFSMDVKGKQPQQSTSEALSRQQKRRRRKSHPQRSVETSPIKSVVEGAKKPEDPIQRKRSSPNLEAAIQTTSQPDPNASPIKKCSPSRSMSVDNSSLAQQRAAAVIVSKKHLGDRPLRQRTPPQIKTPDPDKGEDGRSQEGFAKKYVRSVSTPGPAPDPNDLISLDSGDANLGSEAVKRKFSFAAQHKPNQLLRRSTSTISDNGSSSRAGHQRLGNTRNSVLFLPDQTPLPEAEVFDAVNPHLASDRFSRLSSLKKQIQSQWENAHLGDGLASNIRKRSKQTKDYQAIQSKDCNDEDDDTADKFSISPDISDSESSSNDSKLRLSPPTQVQSLSEGSSISGSGQEDRKEDSVASLKLGSRESFGSEQDVACDFGIKSPSSIQSKESSDEKGISRRKILEAVAQRELRETASQAHLISSASNSSLDEVSSVSDDEKQDQGESLDYIKHYGHVPRLLKGERPGEDFIPTEEEDSISFLTE